jgi:hypothetical protein
LKTSYRVKISVFRGERLALGIFAPCVFIPSTAGAEAFLLLFLVFRACGPRKLMKA